jgi:hypothetical protein
VTFEDAFGLVNYMEEGAHGLVVGNAFGVAATYDAMQFVGDDNLFLLYHIKVADDVEHHVGSYYG